VLAADDTIACTGHMLAVAIAWARGLFISQRTEVTRAPETLWTDILFAGTAVGLEVDDEGGGALGAGHFGRHPYVQPR